MRIYHDGQQLHSFTVASPVSAMAFGRYGTEDCVLATVFKDGGLDIKVGCSFEFAWLDFLISGVETYVQFDGQNMS